MAGSGGVSYGAKVAVKLRRVSFIKCRDCGEQTLFASDIECLCGPCRARVLEGMTVYQRGAGKLPPNLAQRYGSHS